jgi:hypothetical protein
MTEAFLPAKPQRCHRQAIVHGGFTGADKSDITFVICSRPHDDASALARAEPVGPS